jgi:hypothetical protein
MGKTARKLTIDPVKQTSGSTGLRRPRSSRGVVERRANTQKQEGVLMSAERRDRIQAPSVKYTERSTRH